MQRILFPCGVFVFFNLAMVFVMTRFASDENGNDILAATAHLDVWRYLNIAQYGYRLPYGEIDGGDNVFFPLFPALIWLMQKVSGLSWLIAAHIVQKIHLIALVVVSWLYLEREFGRGSEAAKLALLGIFLHPAALFLFVPYTEAQSLVWFFALLWFWPGRRYGWMFFCSLALSLTRPSGMFLGPAVALFWLFERWEKRDFRRWSSHSDRTYATLGVGLGTVVAFSLIMLIQYQSIGDATAFLRYRTLWQECPGFFNFARAFKLDLGMWVGQVVVFWLHVLGGIILWRESRRFESLLCLFSMFMFVYQGKWSDLTRYSYAAIPAWMVLYRCSDRRNIRLAGLIVVALLWGLVLCQRWLSKGWAG